MKSMDVTFVALKNLRIVYDCFVVLSEFGKAVRTIVKGL
jgi:hypothetical protein